MTSVLMSGLRVRLTALEVCEYIRREIRDTKQQDRNQQFLKSKGKMFLLGIRGSDWITLL